MHFADCLRLFGRPGMLCGMGITLPMSHLPDVKRHTNYSRAIPLHMACISVAASDPMVHNKED